MSYTYTKGYDRRGAQMGRPTYVTDTETTEKFHLQLVPMSSCGAYDPGGAYWGIGEPLYVAFLDGDNELFVRADTRELAKKEVHKSFPNCTFYR